MRWIKALVPALACAVFTLHAAADEPEIPYMAKRGEGVVTHEAFDTRAERIPEADRQAVLRDRRRMQDLLNTMLLNAQLAAAARAANFDQTPEVQARMQLAADEELGKAWLQHVAETTDPGDYETMAREAYTLNPQRWNTPKTVNVTHILIGTENRSDEEALSLAGEIKAGIDEDPASFDRLVAEYSDDPSADSNQGRFRNVKRGDMVKPFEDAVFAMTEGEVSGPVRTEYGYHIIRLDQINPPKTPSFEEVHDMLVGSMRRRHQERVRNDYLSQLSALQVDIPEGALEEMVRRQFGEDAVADPGEGSVNE